MKPWAEEFYKGTAWQSCRAGFIVERVRIDGGLCQRCHERLGYIVHHRVELTPENIHDPMIALNHEQLEYVCLKCHNEEHKIFQPAGLSVLFDDDGNAIGILK